MCRLQLLNECEAADATTVFDVANVADEQIADSDLLHFAASQRRKLVFVLDFALKTSKLSLLPPVVERRHQHHDDDGHQDGDAFDPTCLRLCLVST